MITTRMKKQQDNSNSSIVFEVFFKSFQKMKWIDDALYSQIERYDYFYRKKTEQDDDCYFIKEKQ